MLKKEIKGLRVVGLKEDPLKEVKNKQLPKESKVEEIYSLMGTRTRILSAMVAKLTYVYPSTINFYEFIELLLCEDYGLFIEGFLDLSISKIYKNIASEALGVYRGLRHEDKTKLNHLLSLDIPKEEVLKNRVIFTKFLNHFIETHSLNSLSKEDQEVFLNQKVNNDAMLRDCCGAIDSNVDYISSNISEIEASLSLDSDPLRQIFNRIGFIIGMLNIIPFDQVGREKIREVMEFNTISNERINSDFWRELESEMGAIKLLAGFNLPDPFVSTMNKSNCLFILKNTILALDLFISHSPYRSEMKQSLSKFSDIIKRLVFIISETPKSNDIKNTIINSNIDPFFKLSNHNMMNQMNGVGWRHSSSFGANMPQYGMSNNNMMFNPGISLNKIDLPNHGGLIPNSPLNNINYPLPMDNYPPMQTNITVKDLRSVLKEISKTPNFITLSNYINENKDSSTLLDEMINRIYIDTKLSYESALKKVDIKERNQTGILHCLLFEVLRENPKMDISKISTFEELDNIVNNSSESIYDNFTIVMDPDMVVKLTKFIAPISEEKNVKIANKLLSILNSSPIVQNISLKFISNPSNFRLLQLISIIYVVSKMEDIEVDITIEDKTETYKIFNLPRIVISENKYIRREPITKLR